MNERNIVLVALVIVVGLSFFSSFNNTTGKATFYAECEYISDTSIYNPTIISYDSTTNDDIPPKILKSSCATDIVVSNVRCIDGYRPARYAVSCDTGYVCRDGACVVGEVKKEVNGCADSDGGKNVYEKGITTVYLGRGHKPEIDTDYCATEITVTEASCAPGGKKIQKDILRCPTNKCFDGECVR